jgi:Tc5 transposase DNA-binding domain
MTKETYKCREPHQQKKSLHHHHARRKDPERAEKEARLQAAIIEYNNRVKQQKSASKVSINRLAKDFKVPRQTLTGRLNRKQAPNKAHETAMHLTINEEKELACWITTRTQHGYAPRYRTVLELAEIIRNRPVHGVNDDDIQLVTYDEFGRDWVARFMSRHPPLLSARIKLTEATRIKDVSVDRLTKWFEDLQRVIKEYKIEPGNLYNMDESRFAIGDIEASQRIINATIRQAFQEKPGRQEWVTSIECVCADGKSLLLSEDGGESRACVCECVGLYIALCYVCGRHPDYIHFGYPHNILRVIQRKTNNVEVDSLEVGKSFIDPVPYPANGCGTHR